MIHRSLDGFLARNNIDPETWKRADIDWDVLQAIALDHEDNEQRLLQTAEMFAKLIQGFPKVHSVRWRVKNAEHLLEKIVRKRAEGAEKYTAISASNYFDVVTDLIGIRALHLFKQDCFDIDPQLRGTWKTIEKPVVYVRSGDHDAFVKGFAENDFDVWEHPAGYRSVHYVFESRPLTRRVLTEVQVRTIFEEGWSEIDHCVRYPNFSDDKLVEYFLQIFNRMAGSADEMGGFVRGLAETLQDLSLKVAKANAENLKTITSLEKTTAELEEFRTQGKESKTTIDKLRKEIAQLKRQSEVEVDLPGLASLRLLDAQSLTAFMKISGDFGLSDLSRSVPSTSALNALKGSQSALAPLAAALRAADRLKKP